MNHYQDISAGLQLIDSGPLERSANIIPMKRRFTTVGRMMEPQLKSRRLVDDDRISSLPVELIYCILAHLPIHDVARTSILSRTWRNIWKTHTRLILDDSFSLKVSSKKSESCLSAFSGAVDKILFVHTGSIWDFELYVPEKLHQSHIDRWCKHLSDKGIRTLKLSNSEWNGCSIPSYIFDCSELTQLKLSKWFLSPPHKSGCFSNLIEVSLVDVVITSEISFGNQLQKLYLLRCRGIQHLSCQFTNNNNLRRLDISRCDTMDWRCFNYTNTLEVFTLFTYLPNFNKNKPVDLIKLLGSSPRLKSLSLVDLTLQVLGPAHSILERLTTQMVNLKKLRFNLGHKLCVISSSLCLIRNLPNLQVLCVALVLPVKTSNHPQSTIEHYLRKKEEAIEHYLESVDWTNVILHQLQFVEIFGEVGSRSVLHLIKLLAASSPSLRDMTLVCRKREHSFEELFMMKQELLRVPRISPQAQIVWRI
ncbi:F-box/FBD/LRR-repeat protein At1g13570-like [Daucus carota subsp. sativus]|uniref:F-box/FBD/LRR-repeat protein At1g13570-like n=1 Tax=Daucus carota subsp. sativus TaxID=79200 RepID=UPI0007EF0256|nr:PREDICTED: F-box/FBD/LRR-repeat protein At1g13570-like isoform X2 [Daucus carota subsp. sativus]